MSRRPCRASGFAAVVLAGALLASGVLVSCTEGDEVADDPDPTATIPPTTALVVPYLDTAGLPYCEVVDLVGESIRVFAGTLNLGEIESVRDTYLGAAVAFDALEQVAAREIVDDLGLLNRTLADAVAAASEVDWDLTLVTDDAGAGVGSDRVAAAIGHLRVYTQQRCAVDVLGIEPPITTGPSETPNARLLRVLEETFPSLGRDSILCLAARLPVDFDPDDPSLDDTIVLSAMARCGIDPDAPSTPSTTSSTVPDTDSTD